MRRLELPLMCSAALAIVLGWCALFVACAPAKSIVVEGGRAVLLCAKQDQAQLATLGIQLGAAAVRSILGSGSVDWAALGQQAEQSGLELGTCAYAALRATIAGGATQLARRGNDASGAILEAFRDRLGCSVIRTSAGDL